MTSRGRVCVEIVLSVVLFGAPTSDFAREQAAKRDARVPYCWIVTHAAKYSHHVLQIEGIYRAGGEIMSFYSLSCPNAEESSWVDYSKDLRKRTPAKVMKKMEKLLASDGRADIVALVEFDGPKAVTIPPGTPPKLAEVMRGTDSRYGHMNQFATRVLLLKVIKVNSVPATAPWPH